MIGGGNRRRRQDGAAAVEFALVAPLLFILVFGMISYGYMLSFRQALSQGAAEGARAAAVAPSGYTDAQKVTAARNAVNEALGNYDVSCVGTSLMRSSVSAGTCSVAIAACASNTAKKCATVTLNYLYKANSPIPTFAGTGVVLPTTLSYASVAEVS